MIKQLLILILIIGALYYYVYPNYIKPKIDDNINEIINKSNIINNIGIPQDESSDIIYFTSNNPDEILYNCINISKSHNGKVIGFLEIGNLTEPLLEVSNGNVIDIRRPEFKIMNDLWLYDMVPSDVKIYGNKAEISFEYYSSNFTSDIYNAAFNIFEDVPSIDKIYFNLFGEEKFTISKDDIFNNGNNASACAASKDEAYREFVKAYNSVVAAQQKEDMDEINRTYKVYLKARECYESFS